MNTNDTEAERDRRFDEQMTATAKQKRAIESALQECGLGHLRVVDEDGIAVRATDISVNHFQILLRDHEAVKALIQAQRKAAKP